jgi:COX Aromatic Rich Motif
MSAHHAKGAGSTRLVGIVFPKEKWAGRTRLAPSAAFRGDGFSDMHFDVLAVPAERFAAWIEATRNTGPTLDPGSYAALARHSMNTRPFTFRAADPELFQQIVTQKLPPGPGPRTGRPHPSVSPRRGDTILGIPGRAVVWTCLGNSDPNSRVSPIFGTPRATLRFDRYARRQVSRICKRTIDEHQFS